MIEPRRRRALPFVLFLLTCLSTFFTGGAWSEFDAVIREFVHHFDWRDGLAYMLSVMAMSCGLTAGMPEKAFLVRSAS